jgi:hypothetical protein
MNAKSIIPATLLLALLQAGPSALRADVFVLAGGGRVTGDLVNPDESPRKKFIIDTGDGARITFNASQVKQRLRPRPEEVEYEKIRPTYPDTVEGQWELAQWCRDHRLTAQRETHLQRIIELDPDHVEAHRLLGYNKIGGEWVTPDEAMLKKGLKKYKGKWLTPQEIESATKAQERESAQKEWFPKVKRWRNWLGTDRDAQARENFLAIHDPAAVKALAMQLSDENSPQNRVLFIETLAGIGSSEAIMALAAQVIDEDLDEIRLTCLDYLQAKPRPEVVGYFIRKVGDHKSTNAVINRAAVGLGRMKDPAAIEPLVRALVTFHLTKVANTGGDNATSASFGGRNGTPGGAGLSTGNKPSLIRIPARNQCVLDALIAITGQNFGFDQQTWRTWLGSQRKPEVFDPRRN